MLQLADKIEIYQHLEKYHSLFRAFLECGEIQFDSSIETACVTFDQDGDFIDFLFNEEFFESLDTYNRTFVIAHEMVHLILDHGKRIQEFKKKYSLDLINIALDLVVNHLLVDGFGFDRTQIQNWEQFCWVDTIFPNENVLTGKSTEFYINKLKKDAIDIEKHKLVDEHKELENEQIQQDIQDKIESSNCIEQTADSNLIDALNKGLSSEQTKELQEASQQAGSSSGVWSKIQKKKVNKKRKWETVIKKWAVKKVTDSMRKETRWDLIDRRFVDILSSNSNYFLPTENVLYEKDYENNKALVFFFLDTSGSCVHLRDRFFNAARSLPKDKFKIRLFCFDTAVFETTLESGRMYGFGGTAFSPIEQHIQQLIKKEKIKYPDAVWVITDGYGNNVSPEKPQNWYWFLTANHSKHCIPQKSKTFLLSNFE